MATEIHPMFTAYRRWILQEGQPRGKHRFHNARSARWKANAIVTGSTAVMHYRGHVLAREILAKPTIEGAYDP